MTFFFGWYSFKLKSYSASDLNIDSIDTIGVTFEIRQKCFHIFWIPFFSLGKVYVMRRNNELYEIPEAYTQLIKSKDKIRTPFYTYSILIILILSFAYDNLSNRYINYTDYNNEKQAFVERVKLLDKQIENITTNDYLILRNVNDWNDDAVCLKVEEIRDSVINTLYINTPNESNPNSWMLRNTYRNLKYKDTTTLKLSSLKKYVCREFESYRNRIAYDFKGYSIFDNTKKYVLHDIKHIKADGPIIKIHAMYSNRIALLNYGDPVDLIEIINLENDIKWDKNLPLKIPTTKTNNYYGSGKAFYTSENLNYSSFKIKLKFRDSLNNNYFYTIKN